MDLLFPLFFRVRIGSLEGWTGDQVNIVLTLPPLLKVFSVKTASIL